MRRALSRSLTTRQISSPLIGCDHFLSLAKKALQQRLMSQS
jgi:hypothetical protein